MARLVVLVATLAIGLSAANAAPVGETSYAFGRTGGNIDPFTVTIAADGTVATSGPANATKSALRAADLTRIARVIKAQRFYSLSRLLRCRDWLPDFASRFVTVTRAGVARTVLVRGGCRQSAVPAGVRSVRARRRDPRLTGRRASSARSTRVSWERVQKPRSVDVELLAAALAPGALCRRPGGSSGVFLAEGLCLVCPA
jgi:hypothetical protein